ncbi:MAG: branched-chain amino acid ABC transporter permease [Pseudorhodoplanes sp.]|jgi:branched-chain amino acid transport system permease protein|nr:branched-chain amino acid ABC transporter permease [Pseudorhodoplanes sp.]
MRLQSYLEPLVAAALLVCLPWTLGSNTLATEAVTLALPVLGGTLIFGYSGLLSFGQALFFGAGSYVAALLMKEAGYALVPAVAGATVAALAIGVAVGAVSIRRSGIYFVMLTLAFSNLGFFLAYSASGVTGGENGLLDVPRRTGILQALGVNLGDSTVYYGLCAALTFVGYLVMLAIRRSAFGSVLRAVRQNERRAVILGYNARIYKIASFAIAAAFAGLGGALNVGLMHFVSLSNVSVGMSERIVIVTLLGGGQSFLAALFSASIFTGLSDMLASLWPRWMLVLGLIIIVIAFGLEQRVGFAPRDILRRLVLRVKPGKPPQSSART